MKNISKKIFVYILCACLSASALSCSYMRSVYAFEYVGGALAFEEALKWLLGAIGIVSIGGMSADYWENHADDFEDYCAEQNITNATVAEWQLKLCEGILDKGSDCWSAFKSWASSLVGSGSTSPELPFSDYTPTSITNVTSLLSSYYGYSGLSRSDSSTVYNFCAVSNGSYIRFIFCLQDYSVTYSCASNHWITASYPFTGKLMVDATFDINNNSWGRWNESWNYGTSRTLDLDSSYTNFLFLNRQGATTLDNSIYSYMSSINVFSAPNVSGGDMLGLSGVDTENLDIINSDIVDEEDTEVAIPMPGLGASDDIESSDTYDDIVDAINNGLISLDDGISQIQDLLNLLVYDDTTDEVIPFQPDPDSGENKTKDEVIQENKDNMGFALYGLENVFPFCIPWDIVAFINVLKAPPLAPVFNLPFPNVNDLEHPLTVRVDLSDWSDAMAIVRLAEDFLFIIGLAFLTRSMIGAGGDA